MGGACSRKRNNRDDEDNNLPTGISRRYSKSGSLKWLATSFSRPGIDTQHDKGQCPSLMELCAWKIREDINKYITFSVLPRDISQQIINELVYSGRLTDVSFKGFRDCALQDLYLGGYPNVDDIFFIYLCLIPVSGFY